ncbi:MAG: type II secretion system F family protein [Thermodesulfobacteriota bacterium]
MKDSSGGLAARIRAILKTEIHTGGIPSDVIYSFTRKFSVMVGAGIDISRALDVLAAREANSRFKKTVESVALAVRRGESLSSAMEKHPGAFSRLYTGLVKAAESGGNMGYIMKNLSDSLLKTELLRKKVKAAMVYPLTVIVSAVVIMILALSFLVPVFEGIFNDMGAPLPALTAAVIGIAAFVKSNLVAVAVFVSAAVIVPVLLYRRSGRFALFADRMVFFVPVFGKMAHMSILSRFCGTLASLLRGGVPLVSALEVVSVTADNRFFSREVISSAREMVKGRGVVESFSGRERLFPAIFLSMVEAGEQSGSLPRMLETLAEGYMQEADFLSAAVQSSVESAAIFIVGAIVSVIVISMYLPIFSLVSLFSG